MIKRKGIPKIIIEICQKQLKQRSWFHLKYYTDTHTNIGPPEQQVAKEHFVLKSWPINVHPNKTNGWVLDKTSKGRIQLLDDLKNAGIGGIPAGVVALVEDEERDVSQPEEAVAEVVEEDLRCHDEDIDPIDGGGPGVGAPEVDPHLAIELVDTEVCVLLHDNAEQGAAARALVHGGGNGVGYRAVVNVARPSAEWRSLRCTSRRCRRTRRPPQWKRRGPLRIGMGLVAHLWRRCMPTHRCRGGRRTALRGDIKYGY